MKFQSGKAHPKWRGGKSITSHGYKIVRLPNHPKAFKNGYVYEHILVAEQKIGRPLKAEEEIHHLDGNKLNNAEGNIIITQSKAIHKVHHRKENSNLRLPMESNPIILCACGCGKEFLKYDQAGRPRQYCRGGHWRRHRRLNNAT